jgi:hypothetical protein
MDLTDRSGRPGGVRPSARAGQPATVVVEVGELVLSGFDRRLDADLVSAAFTAELERLLRVRGVPPAGADRELDVLSGLPPLPAATSPDRLGVTLARSVHAGLSGRGGDAPGRRR